MCVHYRREVDLSSIDLFLDHRSHSAKVRQKSDPEIFPVSMAQAYSGGFAGSMMTASFVSSSFTR